MFFLLACTAYRTYPALQLDLGHHTESLELSGFARMEDGQVVVSAVANATALYSPGTNPGPQMPGMGLLETFPFRDHRGACPGADCEDGYRAKVDLEPWPIVWADRGEHQETPIRFSDISPFGEDRLLVVTEYSSVGRRTGIRRDYLARPRKRTERLMVLRRGEHSWQEEIVPEIDRLQAVLSDWGRGSCKDDLLVEGLAWDPEKDRVYIGLRRCDGPIAQVLGYDLAAATAGQAVDLQVVANGVAGGSGPEEGVSGLSFAAGRLWAVTAWDSYGYPTEPSFGGRLHEVRDGQLQPLDLPDVFIDQPSAISVLAGSNDLPFSSLLATLLFQVEDAPDAGFRPNMTVLHPSVPRPEDGAFVALASNQPLEGELALGLNGFDFQWYARDHRLSQLSLLLATAPDRLPGAWTRAMGGLWQMTVGASVGRFSASLPGRPKWMGHGRQAVALTDYRSVPGLKFHRYRAVLSVVPKDREALDPSVARILLADRAAYEVEVPLPPGISPDAGVILQGFDIDTSSRANRGICVAAMDVGVDRSPNGLKLRAMLIGGLCNDFDFRGPELRHGRTTDVDGGVEVMLYYALVEGGNSQAWSVSMEDRTVPGAPADSHLPPSRRGMGDAASRAHLHCARVGSSVEVQPPLSPAPPASWLDVATEQVGDPRAPGASLRGFAFAFDPVGFAETDDQPRTDADVLRRNNYVYRYFVRAFGGPDALVQGGFTHGIHRRGPMRDSALPSALYFRADMTSFSVTGAQEYDFARSDGDPNLLPEDSYVRWAVTTPKSGAAQCLPSR